MRGARLAAAVAAALLLLACSSVSGAAAATLVDARCNVTAACRKCEARHMHAEACRATGFAEHLSCRAADSGGGANGGGSFELELKVRRAADPGGEPFRVSRACKASEAQRQAAAAGGRRAGPADGEAPSDDVAAETGDSASEADAADGPKAAAAAAAAAGASLAVQGGASLLKFAAVMALLLGCSLPVVFVRKRRGVVRTGYI